jgi:isoleucyl-tRNA synthetase
MSTHETPGAAAPEPTVARPYAAVAAKVDLPALDRQVLALWADNDVFHRSLAQREGAPEWTFYEGPPTANGTPGTHHVEARVFKDVFPRYKTMRGHHVERRAGWDTHGLPVEVEVEKRLGLPRPARRARGREGARIQRQGRHRGLRRRRVQRPVPGVGPAPRR